MEEELGAEAVPPPRPHLLSPGVPLGPGGVMGLSRVLPGVQWCRWPSPPGTSGVPATPLHLCVPPLFLQCVKKLHLDESGVVAMETGWGDGRGCNTAVSQEE